MKYQKIINIFDNETNQPSRFRIKSWTEKSDQSCATYNDDNEIKLKITMLKSILCDYSYMHILANETIIVTNTEDVDANNTNKKVIFLNCVQFKNCIPEINNAQVKNVQDNDAGMAMYNLIQYSNNYSKISGNLFQYYRDKPALNNDGAIVNFADKYATDSFKFK